MIDVKSILDLHHSMVVRWHAQPVDNLYDGVLGVICSQHSYNFMLWHEEEIAHNPEASDARVAQVKRTIDRYNQLRNNWIEKVDDWITEQLTRRGVAPQADARQNTETSGSVIDRLSVLALRIYHLEEQEARTDVPASHIESVRGKLAIARTQRQDLTLSLEQLLDDIAAGRKRHKTYRALKLYNDPALNPRVF